MMTLEEAKEFYFRYNGFSFHMDREEPVRYNSFRMLGLGKDTLRSWDEELLEGLFTKLWSEPERIWVSHANILRIIRRNNCDAVSYLNRLLDEMDKMESLDLLNITLIIENMAGRNEPMNDGGVYIFCKYPELVPRMDEITEKLIATCSDHNDMDDRFENAVRKYRSAYYKWCGQASVKG